MVQVDIERPKPRTVTARDAIITFERLLRGDLSATLEIVRETFKTVMETDSRTGNPVRVFDYFPQDAAALIVVGLDPRTGEPISNQRKEAVLRECEKDPFLTGIREECELLMGNPNLRRLLAQEAQR